MMWTSLDAPSDRDYFGGDWDADPPDYCPACGAVDDEPCTPECSRMPLVEPPEGSDAAIAS